MAKYTFLLVLALGLFSCKKTKLGCDGSAVPPTIECQSWDVDPSTNGYTVNLQPDGSTKASEGNYEAGVQVGLWKFYYEDGTPFKEGSFTNGEISGFWKLYYPSGNLQEEGSYDKCERNGFWKFYYDDSGAQVEKEGNFDKGSKSGYWKTYKPDGTVETEGNC